MLFLKKQSKKIVERYHCKLNFQSMSSKLSKANISLVVRVGANYNVKLILVFTFKVASVSSAKLLSVLRTRHTGNKNWIQRSPPILISSHSFLKSTHFYQVGDHLICIWAVIIYATLRDQMVIKSRGRHLEFLCFPACLWTMHTRGHLKGKPPPPFSRFLPQRYYKVSVM